MSTTIGSPAATWVDRLEAADAIYRYGTAVDSFDDDALRAVFDDETTPQYGKNTDVLRGREAVVEFVTGFTVDCIWQHHFLNVVRADVEGDRAKVVVYHTSHQVFESAPDTVNVIVGRYHNELRRSDGVFRISRLYMEVLWAERRTDPSLYLAQVGGADVLWTRS
jgi:predicted SnoaL-like aldol condensation-catalyzing enzyme